MKENLQKEIEESLKGFGVENPKVSFDAPTQMAFGDLSTNVAMVYSRVLGKKPVDLANEIKEVLIKKNTLHLTRIDVIASGFINFFFDSDYFAKLIASILEKGPSFAKGYGEAKQKIFIEHTQPNPFKEFHIGHLMNNTIGESIARIVKANGAEVKTCSYHGDVGLHVAKSVWALVQGETLNNAYTRGNKAYEEDESTKSEIVEVNKKIYDKSDSEINKLYEEGRKKSLEDFESIYKRLDSHFDYRFYESESGEIGKKIVLEKLSIPEDLIGVFERSEGAIIFKAEKFGLHTRVFLNSEELPTYEAKEVGLAQMKKEKFPFDLSLTVTANEQDSFFKVVEVAIGEVFPELKNKLHHISHGMLKLPTGKMSSRTGNIISAESLINQVKDKIKEKMAQPKNLPTPSVGKSGELGVGFDNDEIAEIIAIGAIKYSILRQAIGGDITFDFDKSISFEGDSGPYLQYAVVRANSLLQKASPTSPMSDIGEVSKGIFDTNLEARLPSGWQTTNLERVMDRFSEVVKRAGKEYSPHHIVTYLIELSGEFNSFYAGHKIIDETDPTSPYRLALTSAFVQVMTSGLNLLGIKVPAKM